MDELTTFKNNDFIMSISIIVNQETCFEYPKTASISGQQKLKNILIVNVDNTIKQYIFDNFYRNQEVYVFDILYFNCMRLSKILRSKNAFRRFVTGGAHLVIQKYGINLNEESLNIWIRIVKIFKQSKHKRKEKIKLNICNPSKGIPGILAYLFNYDLGSADKLISTYKEVLR